VAHRFAGRVARRTIDRGQHLGRIERVAYVGPLPPTATGIATYNRAVLDGLDRIGFGHGRGLPVDPIWPVEDRHAAEVPAYRLGVYQLGNNVDFHLPIYRLAWQAPGLVVLHDLALDDFVRGLQSEADPLGFVAVREALDARDRLRSADAVRNEPLRTPWVAALARRARGIVVHASFCRRYLEEFGCRSPVYVVPHPPVEEPGVIERAHVQGRELRGRIDARGCRTLVVAAGDMNEAKRLEAVLRAVAALHDGVHVALVGRKVHTYDVSAAVQATPLGERLTVEQDVSDEDFLAWLAAADVVIDLRHPHRGEVSGSLARAMQVGRPTIVSATGTYLDAPEGTVLTVAPGPPAPAELAARIHMLDDDPELGIRMGETARAYMEGLRASEATAKGYAEAIEATIDVVADPVAPTMQRWARALSDIGVTQEYVDAGYGVRYARALTSFKRTS
jgi:glycosyltransferase involved in cell wall biosynthesis